jgi:hypothetical protein
LKDLKSLDFSVDELRGATGFKGRRNQYVDLSTVTGAHFQESLSKFMRSMRFGIIFLRRTIDGGLTASISCPLDKFKVGTTILLIPMYHKLDKHFEYVSNFPITGITKRSDDDKLSEYNYALQDKIDTNAESDGNKPIVSSTEEDSDEHDEV